jgi:phosphatidylglycerophosphate synthase
MATETLPEASRTKIEATYRSRELEGFLDIHFYRKVGYLLARFFARIGFTPDAVTLLSAGVGVLAGHLYFYRDLRINCAGMLLQILSGALDNADGQLARLTNRFSPIGRMLDGVCDNLVFFSVYAHLCLRFTAEGGSYGIWLLAAVAGLSHSWQSATAEFCRYAYLYFATGKLRAIESSSGLRKQSEQLSPEASFLERVLLIVQISYVRGQERFCPGLVRLERISREVFGDEIPPWFRDLYRQTTRSLIRFCNLLRSNTRVVLLFALLFLGRPVWYFVVELTVLNLLLAFVVTRQEVLSRKLESLVSARARS